MGLAERRAREKRQRREDILDAAKKIFSAKGFHGATVEEIAGEAELSPATLYLYFANKWELYASLNLRMLEFLCERIERVDREDGLDPLQKVRQMAEAMYDVYCFDPDILTNVLRMQASPYLEQLPDKMRDQVNAKVAQALRAFAKIFQKGVEQGYFPDFPPMALSDIIWSVFTGLVLLERSKNLFDSQKDYLKPTLFLAIEIMAQGMSSQGMRDYTQGLADHGPEHSPPKAT
ncbi:MAG: TetR/AcrR family transcriptional regulator [Desulfarculaceae bacterium]|nr:TetR/AcrR family transcriptional regulator [Desulfarculaceae bacterium]MCF8071348.1 TetR/AcrR family transcriptional regulator [Desulfarculaceae bacterium]MCF8101673.1 TetR/AcrR family transcriptional regulator [Desulfarculaceae bacterium]MCF8116718.1 TetR/AcrR family transcriptional regulator [Desulfarculaceae bacterium]